MIRFATFLFYLITLAVLQEKKTFSFAGKIVSMESEKPISGVSVSVNKHHGTTSDTSGRFILKGLKPGKYTFRFGCPGFLKKDTMIYIRDFNINDVHIQLKKRS